LKPEEEWSAPEDEHALANFRALNAIFNGVDKNMFRMIKQCNVAKDAWETQGTLKIKSSKIQLLTTEFENLKMKEDETIRDYYMNVLDIANSFGSLGEKLSNEKLIRKILRSLPKRFDMKVTTIEEAQDTASMKVEELIESLQNFEIMINNRKEKYIAPSPDMQETQESPNNNDNLARSVVLLQRLFNIILKQANWKSKSDVQNLVLNIKEKQNDDRIFSTDDKGSQLKEVQCYECEWYGHTRTECATFQKKQKKSLTDAWPDEDISDKDSEYEPIKRVAAFTGRVFSNTNSCDEELAYDDLAASYKELYFRSAEICKFLGKQKNINSQFLIERSNHLAKIS